MMLADSCRTHQLAEAECGAHPSKSLTLSEYRRLMGVATSAELGLEGDGG